MAKPLITKAQPVHGPEGCPGPGDALWRVEVAVMSLSKKVLFTRSKVHIPWSWGWTRLPVQETLSEADIKVQLPKGACVHGNYWGVLRAEWEPKTCNYSNVRQLFSAQEVGLLTPSLRSPYYS